MPGVELSTDMDGVDCHLLGLGLRWEQPAWQDFLAAQRTGRRGRLETMASILAREGAPVEVERVLEIAGEASVGRPHVARALVERGYVDTVAEAFDRWLGNGKVADVPREKLEPEEAIERLHALEGIAVVAHPPFMGDDCMERVRKLAAQGADGVEVYYKHYPPPLVTELASWATSLGLVASGGSDYHGLGNPDDRPIGAIPFPDDAVRRFVEFCEDQCAVPWLER
jgi:predicted metal-dependent phosphoesterase TrpH